MVPPQPLRLHGFSFLQIIFKIGNRQNPGMGENHLLESVGKRVTCALVEALNPRPVYEVQQINLIITRLSTRKLGEKKKTHQRLTLLAQSLEL